LSPVTTARTVYEGDFDYSRFVPFLGGLSLPAFSTESTISCEEPGLQRTLAIIKPEAMIYKDVVLKAIVDKGFSIIGVSTIHCSALGAKPSSPNCKYTQNKFRYSDRKIDAI
jgi:hypothetical protein